jgi:hypothetical protein
MHFVARIERSEIRERQKSPARPVPDFAEPVIGPVTSARTRRLDPGYLLRSIGLLATDQVRWRKRAPTLAAASACRASLAVIARSYHQKVAILAGVAIAKMPQTFPATFAGPFRHKTIRAMGKSLVLDGSRCFSSEQAHADTSENEDRSLHGVLPSVAEAHTRCRRRMQARLPSQWRSPQLTRAYSAA